MLTKRVQVLFEPSEYSLVQTLAKNKGVSMGEFLRSTVRKQVAGDWKDKVTSRRKVINEIRAWRKKVAVKASVEEILEWIRADRKYEDHS